MTSFWNSSKNNWATIIRKNHYCNIMETVTIKRKEYDSLKTDVERLKETVAVLSNKNTVKKLEAALRRFDKGEFLTEEQMA